MTDISIDEEAEEVLWYSINGNDNKVKPWIVEPKRSMGSQYINTHNGALARALNCNTNIQIGDQCQLF